MKTIGLIPCMLVVLASCTLGPDFQRPAFLGAKQWKEASATGETRLPDDWWQIFHDSELTRLIKKALQANQDLAAVQARVTTARALVGVDRARMFPILNLSGSANRVRYSQDTLGAQLPPGVNIPLEQNRYRSTFDLSYDLDIWGRNRRLLESAQAKRAAAESLLDAQRLLLASELTRQYYLLRGLDQQAQILKSTIAVREQSFDLLKSKLDAGISDALPMNQAETDLALARNDLALVERQRGAAEHALAVLCGESPSEFSLDSGRNSHRQLPAIHPGLPVDVLSRRPDVRAAEQELRAANAQIGVAEAAFYPNFNLISSGGYEALDISRFLNWQNRVLSLGAGVTAPVFHGGANRASWKAAVSQRDESLARYKNTLLLALREVEDALLDLNGLAKSRAALEAALKSVGNTQQIAEERYDKGLISYLEVIDAQRVVLSVKLLLAQCDANQRITLAVLAKALGGGWKAG